MSSVSFLGCLTPTLTRQQRGTVRPGMPQMAPPKSGFDLGVMHGVAVCLHTLVTHLVHGTPSVHTREGHAPVVHLCSLPAHAHNGTTVTRVTNSLTHRSQAGLSCFFVPWASQFPVSVLFPRTTHPPQKPWVITTVTSRMPGKHMSRD